MCGIAGIALREQVVSASALGRMDDAITALRHRGPDAQGRCVHAGVVLGHTRLSILDLTTAGRQPMETADGRFAITYNGECYNFRDIVRDLGFDDLRSGTDTEVVLRAFAQEGAASIRRLNGMFAFALHDRESRELWLVRDRLGIKPLYYSLGADQICFASEIRALLALLGHTPRCDTSLLHEWLYYGNSLGGKTLFHGIQQLLPGHALRLTLDDWRSEVNSYWSLSTQCREPAPTVRGPALAASVRELLAQAVQRQLVSDVPVGIFLSGGVDSSAIATFASAAGSAPIRTYCVGFDDPSFPDERPRARRLANRLGTDHHDWMIRGDGLESVVESLIDHHGSPFFDAANIPLWLMARDVGQHAKVILQGDGGDEIFGGYRRYTSLHRRMLYRIASVVAMPLLRILPNSPLVQRARRYANIFRQQDTATTMALLLTAEGSDRSVLKALGPAARDAMELINPLAHHLQVAAAFEHLRPARRMLMVDQSIVLPDLYLEKVDRATMAHGLEVRVPFLDHELVDFMARVPAEQSMPHGRTKWLLKQALRGVVPDEILDGPKTGFNVPFGRWLRGPLHSHFLEHLEVCSRAHPGFLDLVIIRKWIAMDAAGTLDLSSRLWKIYNLAVWANRFKVAIPT
jgi:asparagine synthase (glutamine-hydrolysing)